MSLPNLRVFIKYAETIKKVDTSIAKYSFPLSKEIFSKIPFSREINITKQSCIAPTKIAKTIFLDK